MLVQLRTDNHIPNTEELRAAVQAEVDGSLALRYGDRLRRVEVYVQDMNSHKGGIDTRCAVEVHLAGMQAVTAEDRAASKEEAISGAVEKVMRALEHKLGRIEDRAGHTSAAGEEG